MRFTGNAGVRHLLMRDSRVSGCRASKDASDTLVLTSLRCARFNSCTSAIHVGGPFYDVRRPGYEWTTHLRRVSLARKSLLWSKAGLPHTERARLVRLLRFSWAFFGSHEERGEGAHFEFLLPVAGLPELGDLISLAHSYFKISHTSDTLCAHHQKSSDTLVASLPSGCGCMSLKSLPNTVTDISSDHLSCSRSF